MSAGIGSSNPKYDKRFEKEARPGPGAGCRAKESGGRTGSRHSKVQWTM